MERGGAFLVVGHRQWGKSRTLKALTEDSHRVRWVNLAGRQLFIRRMSNDDKPGDFRRLVREMRPTDRPLVILAFCPAFDEDADDILDDLSRHYDIFSFALRLSHDGTRCLSPNEIEKLQKRGTVEVFERQADPTERSRALRVFVERHVRRSPP